jgi:hypothetical protein
MQEVHSTRLPSAAYARFLLRVDVQRQDQATMQRNTLLATRLHIPHPRLDLVPRPRLTHRLNEGATRKLTLITAPAGFGKTTLLSEWITQSSKHSAAAIATFSIICLKKSLRVSPNMYRPSSSILRCLTNSPAHSATLSPDGATARASWRC